MNDSSMRVRGSLSPGPDGPPAAVRDAEVILPERPARVAVELDAVAVIDKLADRDAFGELRQAAHVVAVEVGDEHVVELGDAGVPHGGLNPVGVAPVRSGPAGVHQHRFALGGDHEGGGAAPSAVSV